MYISKFKDKNGSQIKEGDYISKTETMRMNNHYYDGMVYGTVNREPYREWDATGTNVYLIEWSGDCLIATRVKMAQDLPASAGFHYLNKAFKSDEYEIIGNKFAGYTL